MNDFFNYKTMGKIEKFVYDLDNEDFSATKATPFTGNRGKKSLIKTEGSSFCLLYTNFYQLLAYC